MKQMKMTKKVHKLYVEGDCGWLKVKKAKLVKLGIADKITEKSFMRGDNAYLDKDTDAKLFEQTMKDKGFEYGIKTFASKGRNSKIRKYAKFSMLNVGSATQMPNGVVAPKKVDETKAEKVRVVDWSETENLVIKDGIAGLYPKD